MIHLVLNPEFKISDILTAFSIFAGIVVTLYVGSGIIQQREYADRIRRSATEVIIKLERWKELNLHFFKELQKEIEERTAGVYLGEEKKDEIRDIIWTRSSDLRADILEKVIDEQIHHAYKDLYLYDPNIEKFFDNVISQLSYIELKIYQNLLNNLQNDIWEINETNDEQALKNRMTLTANLMAYAYEDLINESLKPIRHELNKVIQAPDRTLFKKKTSFKNCIIVPEIQRLTIQGLEHSLVGEYANADQKYDEALKLVDFKLPGLWGLRYMSQRDGNNEDAENSFKRFMDLIRLGDYSGWAA